MTAVNTHFIKDSSAVGWIVLVSIVWAFMAVDVLSPLAVLSGTAIIAITVYALFRIYTLIFQ